jgi:hypothetical protein
MGKTRIIRDIRFYESRTRAACGEPLPGNVGDIVRLPALSYEYGKRIARTLENDGFSIGAPDHIYFNFTTAIAPGTVERGTLELDDRIVYVDAGVDLSHLAGLSDEEADDFIMQMVFRGLALLAPDERSIAVLDTAKQRVLTHRTELSIFVKKKKTRTYCVEVFCKIRPRGRQSIGIIRYSDLHRGLIGEKVFVELLMASHIYPLVGNISVSKGTVTIKPRESFRSQFTAQHYPVPVSIPVDEILRGGMQTECGDRDQGR